MSDQDRPPRDIEGAHHFRGAPGLAMLFAIALQFTLPLIAAGALGIWITGPWEILAIVPLLVVIIAEERYKMWMAFIGGTLARAFTRGGRHD